MAQGSTLQHRRQNPEQSSQPLGSLEAVLQHRGSGGSEDLAALTAAAAAGSSRSGSSSGCDTGSVPAGRQQGWSCTPQAAAGLSDSGEGASCLEPGVSGPGGAARRKTRHTRARGGSFQEQFVQVAKLQVRCIW